MQKINASPRIKISLNDKWNFFNGDINNSAKYNEVEWQNINIPHSWNLKDAYSDSIQYRRGIGWYKKILNIDSSLINKKLFLYFEGANQTAEVYVNDKFVGKHIGGYTAFALDITNQINFSQVNVLTVKVDNSYNPNIPPLDADFTFYGGIYRDVWLIAAEDVHIGLLDNASPGVFISTQNVSAESASINIKGKIVNESNQLKNIRVLNKVLDEENIEVKVLSSKIKINKNSSSEFTASGELINPKLWSPDDPYLYKIITEIYDGDKLVDEIINPLGIRWFNFDGEGFSLNGKKLKLTGTNRHQDYPQFGNALPNWAHQKDLKLIKDNGFNFVRLAHYPQDPTTLQTADEIGLIVWEEIPVVNTITLSDEFKNNCKKMLVEMIRQHYNHPSILMWGYMNEIRLRPPKQLPENYYKKITELENELNEIVKKEDSTRATVTAYFSGEVEHADGYENIPDVVGMNLYFGWYYNDFDAFGKFVDDFHTTHPNTPIIISEYGGGSDERIHASNPQAFDFSAEYQQMLHESTFKQIMERDYIAGSALWNQFDFGSKLRDDTKPNLNQKGINYFDRTPKDISFYYKAFLKNEPILYFAVRDYQSRAGSNEEAKKQNIKIYTNLNEVEVLLNNISLGKFKPQNFTINFSCVLQDGKNLLTAKGTNNQNEIIDEANIIYDDRTSLFNTKNSNHLNSSGKTIAVNCGSNTNFIDESGLVWEADKRYEKGSWGFEAGNEKDTHHRINFTDDDPLFQSANDSVSFYQFDVIDGLYEVKLKICEIQEKNTIRKFSIKINDQVLLEDLNLESEYGIYNPAQLSSQILVKGNNGIKINFEKISGNTLINGILIRRIY